MNTLNTRTGEAVGSDEVRKKIISVLTIYPRLSQSMLQVGIGNTLPSSSWRPVLEILMNEKIILRETKFVTNIRTGRNQTFYIFYLNPDMEIEEGEYKESDLHQHQHQHQHQPEAETEQAVQHSN